MNDFEKEVVLISMKHMFQGNHFSICDVDKCIKITGAIPDINDYNALSALHCVNWSEMSPELRQIIVEKTVNLLSCEGLDLSELELRFNNNSKVFEIPQKKKVFGFLKK